MKRSILLLSVLLSLGTGALFAEAPAPVTSTQVAAAKKHHKKHGKKHHKKGKKG